MIVLTLFLVQPERKQLSIPPPWLQQSLLRLEWAAHPDTEHGLILLPPSVTHAILSIILNQWCSLQSGIFRMRHAL